MSYIYNIRDDGKTDEPISDSLVIKRLLKEGCLRSCLDLACHDSLFLSKRTGAALQLCTEHAREWGTFVARRIHLRPRRSAPIRGLQRPTDVNSSGHALQKGGVPAAPSGTATLLRLSPSHLSYPRPLLAVTDFRHSKLPWLDGRCVQGPGTYSPRHG